MEKTLIGLGLFALAGAVVFNTVYQPAHAQSAGAVAKCEVVPGLGAGRITNKLPELVESHKRRGASQVQVYTVGDAGLFLCSY